MLTSNSFEAVHFFLPFVNKKKGNLYKLFKLFESISSHHEIVSIQTVKKKITLDSLQDEHYIDEHLKLDILKLSNCKTVVFKTNKTTFTLHIHYKRESIDKLIHLLCFMLSYVTSMAPHRVKDVTCNYYLLDVKRVFDGDNYLDKEEVNGGVCRNVDDSCEFTVWRKEEILKVSIHELIHGLGYDYRNDTNSIIKHYRSKYNITSPVMNTYEGYTEIMAELIHSYLVSKFYHNISPTFDLYDLFVSNVGIEAEFSRFQSSKVVELFQKKSDANKFTNVVAYSIITTELYNNLDDFIHFCLVNNTSFVKIKNKSRYLSYLKKVSKVEKKEYPETGYYLKNTTRMTCLEIDLF